MFSRMKNFFYRHRRKFIFGGILVGGSILAAKYGQRKFIEWQEEQGKIMLNRIRKQNLYENTDRTCNQTIASLSAPLKDEVLAFFKNQNILDEIKRGAENKIELFEKLKIKTFAQHASLLYGGMLLVVNLKIQLGILSGYMCVGPSETNENVDVELRENYLTQCEFLITTGMKDLCSLIERHAKQILTDVPLKQKLSLGDIENVFWNLQRSISNDPRDPIKCAKEFLFPSFDLSRVSPTYAELLQKMLNETIDVLESTEVRSLMESCLSKAFSNSIDKAAEYFLPGNTVASTSSSAAPSFRSVNEISVAMAKVIPIIHNLDKSNGLKISEESWVKQYILMSKIKALGANIFEAFSCPLN